MIGKPDWFQRRKYGGWGIVPKTWQGWVYIAIFMLIMFGIQLIPIINSWIRLILSGIVGIILIADIFHIMANIKKDEREKIHEAIAERNALWAIIFVLCVGIAYQISVALVKAEPYNIDPVIIIAVFAALIVKAITNIYLDKKD